MMPLTTQAACFLTRGEEFLLKKDYVQAIDLFERGLATAQHNQDSQAEALALLHLGRIHLVQNQPALALSSVEQALSIASEQGNLYTLYDCHRQLAQTHKVLRNFEQSLQHFEIAESIREDILRTQAHPAIRYAYPGLLQALPKSPSTLPSTVFLLLRMLVNHRPMGLHRFNARGLPLEVDPVMAPRLEFAHRQAFMRDPALEADASQMKEQSNVHQAETPRSREVKMPRQDGCNLGAAMTATAVTDRPDPIYFYEGSMEDSSAIKATHVTPEELAMRDPLTQLYSRPQFFELASRAMARSYQLKRPVSLLILEIDHFNSIRDRYGHFAGDHVLRTTVQRMKNNLRQGDILARYGGEAFIILMAEATQPQGWNGAERLRKLIADRGIDGGDDLIGVTVSVGVTSWVPDSSGNPPRCEELIKHSEQALYHAKQAGCNQTLAYSKGLPSWPDNHAWPTCGDEGASEPAAQADAPSPD